MAFGYPSVTGTPRVANLDEDVRAFKIAFASDGLSIVMTGGERFHCSVDETVVRQGAFDAQRNAYFAYYVGGIPVNFHDVRSWEILLYRPGYDVIEMPSRWWGRTLFEAEIGKLTWNRAPNLDAQEKAIERVCPDSQLYNVSAEVRRFASDEYMRLAGSPDLSADQREAFLSKARRLQSPRVPQ
jgi:hypothetical protein